MRNVISFVAGVAFVAALAVPALPAFAADETIKGEVVEIACLTSKKDAGKGDAHAACAMSCAKRGQPMGDPDGRRGVHHYGRLCGRQEREDPRLRRQAGDGERGGDGEGRSEVHQRQDHRGGEVEGGARS